MTKYFCDICGKEVTKFNSVEVSTDIDFVKSENLKAAGIFNRVLCMLCRTCYEDMQKWYENGLNEFKTSRKVLPR